ncbi:hypothetical protein Glove_219g64 [Diversispora epigaea]|uniref:AIG1-type G domain-containing protein n=1 Tax=Diversispora epigaea TaxID=1348612 RepID=A0A397IIX3_9GLOM|nr:hypothetical protein Glove_219g64 [Diversispora epigaea]
MKVIKFSLVILVLNQVSSWSASGSNYHYQSLNNDTLPSILIIGKTGAGKSTLGNYLMVDKKQSFEVGHSQESATITSSSLITKIGGEYFKVVDTPGLFDTKRTNEEIINEITRAIQNCAFGIKAILFVLQFTRISEEEKTVIKIVKGFLGEDTLRHFIIVFSKCGKPLTFLPPQKFKKLWCDNIRNLVNSAGNRWSISPNSDFLSPGEPEFEKNLEELRQNILSIDGVYAISYFEEYRRAVTEKNRRETEAEDQRSKERSEREDAIRRAEIEKELRLKINAELEYTKSILRTRYNEVPCSIL